MSYKSDYPVGTKIPSYPSSNGDFPAEIIGYRYEKNLNTGQTTAIIRVLVHGTTDEGEQVDFEEGFAPSYAPV
jgi:hypothetical protein